MTVHTPTTVDRDSGTVRLSVRELLEIPYRVLRAAGASHGEAHSTAAAVQFAELHSASGLRELLEFCWQYQWGQRLSAVRESDASYRVTGLPLLDPLQVTDRVVDLVSAALTTGQATERGFEARAAATNLPVTSLFDLPLTRAASRHGVAFLAAERRGQRLLVRYASAQGDFGACECDAKDLGANTDLLESFAALEQGETVVLALPEFAPTWLEQLTPVSAAQLEQRRADAALGGVPVDAEQWARVLGLSEKFKKPESEESMQ